MVTGSISRFYCRLNIEDMITLDVSSMRYKILVKQPTVTRDEYGAEKITYTTLHTLKASKKHIGGSKGVDSNEIFTTTNIVFEIHYRDDIDEEMVIEYDSKNYRINQIVEIGYRQGLQITVEKINE